MRILFLCTGNTCRSPMAEGLLRKLALERGLSIEVRSAGVSTVEGMPISHHAEAVLRDHQIEDRITSTPISRELANWADLILTLTHSHKRQLIQFVPEAASKTYTLKEYVENDEQVLRDLEQLRSLYATREMNRAMGRPLDAQDEQLLIELQQRIPVYDISDPFGGSRDDYEVTAAEIRISLDKLIIKLENRALY